MKKTYKEKISLFKEIINLNTVKLSLGGCDEIYREFTKPHAKYRIIKSKTLGVALLRITENKDGYMTSINGKNSAAYYARKAVRNGYSFHEIEPASYLDDIYSINTSKEYRQGKPMNRAYTKRIGSFQKQFNYKYFGILSSEGQLVAYAWVPRCGDVWILSCLLGHAEHLNQGIMYLLVTSIACEMIALHEQNRPSFLMYDMFLSAKEGLKNFKKKCGFMPYRVRWEK